MSTKGSKTNEERIIELYIKEYITKTQYYAMYNRIKKEMKIDGKNI